jgi:hypothetical protein
MATGSPFRPPHDGERGRVVVEMRFSARAVNGLRSMKAYLKLDELRDVVRKGVMLLERAVAGEQAGKQLCLRDPKTGEFEVLKL